MVVTVLVSISRPNCESGFFESIVISHYAFYYKTGGERDNRFT